MPIVITIMSAFRPYRDASRRSSTSDQDQDKSSSDLEKTPEFPLADATTTTTGLAYEKGRTLGAVTTTGGGHGDAGGEVEFDPYNTAGGVDRPWKYKGPALACIIFLTRESSSGYLGLGPASNTDPHPCVLL